MKLGIRKINNLYNFNTSVKLFFYLLYFINLRYDSRKAQPFNRILELWRPPTFLKKLVLETCIFLWELNGYVVISKPCLLYFIQIPIIGSLACALSGILFVFSLAHKIADYKPNLFGSWRNYTYQIYLMHMYPIMVCKYLYKIHLFPNDDIWFVSIWISSLVCSIALPTIVSKVVEKTSNNLKILIGLWKKY